MFKYILTYELRYWLKKPVLYLYFVVFFGLAFISVIGTAGLFDPPPSNNQIERLVNSPFEINYILQYFCKLLLFLLPAIIGATTYKDYKNNVHSVLYSFPIKKRDYIFGKFLSGFVLVAVIAILIGIAMLIAEQFPGLHDNKIGTFKPLGYLQALFVFVIPNLLFFGLIVFAAVTYFRNIYAGFIAVIVLFFIQNITKNAFSGIAIALFDPFGQNAVAYETQNWTLADQNSKFIPVFGAVLYNRLIWLFISGLVFAFVYKRFAFTELPIASLFKKRKNATKKSINVGTIKTIALPEVRYSFSGSKQLNYAWLLSKVNLQTIAKSWMFYIILFFGILSVLFSIARVTNNSEMTILPVTHVVLTIPAFFFTTIIMLLTFIYSGMLVHKDITSNMNQLVDAAPISNLALLISKVIAVVKMQAILLFIMMLVGICIQIYNGYYQLEIGLYLFHLFVVQFIALIIWAFASVFVHTLLKNTYAGIFLLILSWLAVSGFQQIGITTNLLLFNFSEPMPYSDLNGYGNMLQPYFLVKGYWLAYGIILLILAYLFFNRGIVHSIKERLQQSKFNFNRNAKIVLSIFLTVFIALGFAIHSEESKSQELSDKDRNKAFKTFEEDFKKYASIVNQPKVTDIALVIDIFPETNKLSIKGQYNLINTSNQAIDTLLIKTGFDETTSFKTSRDSKIIDEDSYVKFSVLKFNKPLKPNQSFTLDFELKNESNTLFENNSNVLNNGTFFKNDILPRIGYFLAQDQKYPRDSLAKYYNYYSKDSDSISLSTIISTSNDQIAIAPGYLKKQWTENNRNYYLYETENNIKNSLSFSSGAFQIEKEEYNGVNLEIYHHKNHTQNLEKMKAGLKASLDYNTKYFGNYQFTEARIIEFPITEGTYASVMANSIPTSEMRFIANSSDETIDISFYTIAHELTHQWFGNQLVPANAYGATMLSESITEYISLNIYEQHFGKQKAKQFLKAQHKRYLKGRAKANEEPPLYMVKAEQQYLAYGKGTIAFNTLSHYLGKEKLHVFLKGFLNTYKDKPTYPTATDLIDELKSKTPDSLDYLIGDYFETVTIHDTKIISATVNQNEVAIHFEFSKYRNENEALPVLDYVEIGFYDKKDELISIEQILINSKDNRHQFYLKESPSKIVLDPNLLLIEKNTENNIFKL